MYIYQPYYSYAFKFKRDFVITTNYFVFVNTSLTFDR